MVDMCGQQLFEYDMVVRFERFHADSRALLERLELWELYGRQGWGDDGRSNGAARGKIVARAQSG